MVKGLYTAYTGLLNEQKRLDVISNNLANSATTGFKKDGTTAQSFKEVLTLKINDSSTDFVNKPIGKMSLGVKLGEVYTDYTPGSIRETQNTYDFSIGGSGFFGIRTIGKDGTQQTRYTRDGSFTLSKDGTLLTKDGGQVLGQDGNVIQIPKEAAANLIVDESGTLSSGSQIIGTIGVTDFEDYNYLSKVGDSMYEATQGAVEKVSTAAVNQGFLEMSNVNVVSEMVQMISVSRAYETSQKMMQTVDSMIDKSVNSVGRL